MVPGPPLTTATSACRTEAPEPPATRGRPARSGVGRLARRTISFGIWPTMPLDCSTTSASTPPRRQVSMGGMIAGTDPRPSRPGSQPLLDHVNTGDKIHGRPARRSCRASAGRGPERPTDRDAAISLGVETWRQISGPGFDGQVRSMVTLPSTRPRSLWPDQLLAIRRSDRTRIHSVTAPTLVVHGCSTSSSSRSGGMATRAAPGSRLLMFPDMAHDLPRTRVGNRGRDRCQRGAPRASSEAIAG